MAQLATKPTVYIETTIVSYLTARPSSDVVQQGNVELTKRWWHGRRAEFELFTSQFVLDEAGAGDPAAAAERLAVLDELDLLAIPEEVEPLARRIVSAGALPAKARVDALHLSVATVNGMQFLLTWNCKHLANAMLRRRIEDTCRSAGYEPPAIGTPHELMGSSR